MIVYEENIVGKIEIENKQIWWKNRTSNAKVISGLINY